MSEPKSLDVRLTELQSAVSDISERLKAVERQGPVCLCLPCVLPCSPCIVTLCATGTQAAGVTCQPCLQCQPCTLCTVSPLCQPCLCCVPCTLCVQCATPCTPCSRCASPEAGAQGEKEE